MANSLDQIFRNFINRITGGDDEDTVAEKQSGQGGLMAPRVVRPRARPEDVEPIGGVATGAASTGNIAIKRFVDGLNQATKLDVSLRPKARPLENTLIDANLSADTLQLKHNMPVYKFQQENESGSEDGSTIKISPAPTSDAAIDEIETKTSTIFNKIKEKVKADRRGIESLDVATSAMALGVIPIKGKSYTPTIRDTQIMLDSAGYNVGKIDGIDGPLTQAAVKAFQKDAGFTGRDVDGKFGPKTLAAFMEKNPQVTKEKLPITKEELPSVKENTISVIAPETSGPPTVPSDLRTPLGTARAASIREQQEGIPTARLENLQDAQVSSIIDSIPVPESIKKGIKNVSMVTKAVLSPTGRNFMNDILFGGKLGYVNPLIAIPGLGIDKKAGMLGLDYKVGAEVFSEDALNLMRQMVLDKGIIDKGSVSIGKEVYGKGGLSVKQTGGASAKEIAKSLAEGSNPINEVKLMLGQFNAKINDSGDIIVTDQFNYNEIINPIDGKKYTPEQYEKAIEDGKFTEVEVLMNILEPIKDGELNYEMVRALGFVLGSRSYEDEDKRQGRLFEINLGPAVTRPRARPDN